MSYFEAVVLRVNLGVRLKIMIAFLVKVSAAGMITFIQLDDVNLFTKFGLP